MHVIRKPLEVMLHTWLSALLSALVVSLISFVGVFLLSLRGDRLGKVLIYLVSFAVGALLGNALFHLLPESYAHLSSAGTAWLCAAGFLVFFLLEQLLHAHPGRHGTVKHYGYLSLYADAIHNFTDGILIAVAWIAGPEVGLATTIAIVLHEIPQEISDFGVLLQAGFTRRRALLYNFYSACTSILGAVLTLWIGERLGQLSIYVLPFAAGGFLYLAATSLLPEILKGRSHHRTWLYLLCIVAGVLVMFCFSTSGGHGH